MDEVKTLILIIQVSAAAFATLRIISIGYETMHEEDNKPGLKKIRNILIALLIIELVFPIGSWLKMYWKFEWPF